MINIAILEDMADVSEVLKSYINEEEDMICEYCYSNAEDAITFIPQYNLDILIVDIVLPRASGIEAIINLSEKCPELQYCMFTVYEDDEKVFRSINAGAKGFIIKGTSKEKITSAIRELYNGGAPMSPSIARRIIDKFKSIGVNPKVTPLPLTDREIELLQLLSKGMFYKEIAAQLNISVGTVKQHIHKIYNKLQVSNKVEAINKLKDHLPD